MACSSSFYIQPCPICGRRLRVCVEYLGRQIQCRHCHAVFMAFDPESTPASGDPQATWLERVNELLESVESTRQPVR